MMLGKLFGRKKQQISNPSAEAARLGVDLQMMYCPACGDEYRAGMEQCVACEVGLISGQEKFSALQVQSRKQQDRNREITATDTLVAIRSGKMRDLKPVQVLLAKHMIPSMLAGDAGNCSSG